MSEAFTQALAAVMELPEAERLALADAVYESLPTPPGLSEDDLRLTPEEDDTLFAELERRRAEHESGRDPGIPADEVFAALKRKPA